MNQLYIDYISKAIPWSQLSESMRKCYEDHYTKQIPQNQSVEEFYSEMAGIHPEFSQLIGVSLGYVSNGEFRSQVLINEDPEKLFVKVAATLEIFSSYDYHLISWNLDRVRSYLIKKYLERNSAIPKILKDYQNKQWEQSDVNVQLMYKNCSLYPCSIETAASYLGYQDSITEDMQFYLSYRPLTPEVLQDIQSRCLDLIKMTKYIYEKIKDLL